MSKKHIKHIKRQGSQIIAKSCENINFSRNLWISG